MHGRKGCRGHHTIQTLYIRIRRPSTPSVHPADVDGASKIDDIEQLDKDKSLEGGGNVDGKLPFIIHLIQCRRRRRDIGLI